MILADVMGILLSSLILQRERKRDASHMARGSAGLVLLLALCACTQITPRANVPYVKRPSPNFDERRPNFVIIHHISNDGAVQALSTLTDPSRRVSSHYLITRDGTTYYLVDELARAWHAGESYWGGNRDLNSASIGIELENDDDEPFSEPQIEALLELLADIKGRYKIPTANFLGHGDIAPTRKTDPSRRFPWKRLAEHGFGLWCEPPYPPVSGDMDAATLLAALGYDTWNLNAVRAAFKRHFAPEDASNEMTAEDLMLLNCLLVKKNLDR